MKKDETATRRLTDGRIRRRTIQITEDAFARLKVLATKENFRTVPAFLEELYDVEESDPHTSLKIAINTGTYQKLEILAAKEEVTPLDYVHWLIDESCG